VIVIKAILTINPTSYHSIFVGFLDYHFKVNQIYFESRLRQFFAFFSALKPIPQFDKPPIALLNLVLCDDLTCYEN